MNRENTVCSILSEFKCKTTRWEQLFFLSSASCFVYIHKNREWFCPQSWQRWNERKILSTFYQFLQMCFGVRNKSNKFIYAWKAKKLIVWTLPRNSTFPPKMYPRTHSFPSWYCNNRGNVEGQNVFLLSNFLSIAAALLCHKLKTMMDVHEFIA